MPHPVPTAARVAAHGARAFVPGAIGRGRPGSLVDAGPGRGIAASPGEPSYEASKAGTGATASIGLPRRGSRDTPGRRPSARPSAPSPASTPPAAWAPEQAAGFLLRRPRAGTFRVPCRGGEVPRSPDGGCVFRAVGDAVEDRPAPPRRHPDRTAAFAARARG